MDSLLSAGVSILTEQYYKSLFLTINIENTTSLKIIIIAASFIVHVRQFFKLVNQEAQLIGIFYQIYFILLEVFTISIFFQLQCTS
jgi:hypothetical protein